VLLEDPPREKFGQLHDVAAALAATADDNAIKVEPV